jgi:hypothetical protein
MRPPRRAVAGHEEADGHIMCRRIMCRLAQSIRQSRRVEGARASVVGEVSFPQIGEDAVRSRRVDKGGIVRNNNIHENEKN